MKTEQSKTMSEYTDPTELSDEQLYTEYQIVKEHGPTLRIDELQREIAERWEDEYRSAGSADMNELREEIQRMIDQEYDRHINSFSRTVTLFCKRMVEESSMTPSTRVVADVPLTWKERISGRRSQDVTAMLSAGVMLGTALERDIPKGSEIEQRWRDGELTFEMDIE